MNAGTVECLYQDGEFWFLEMNTRLQVEHCVTEEVTQLDLVAEQLRVAAGEPLSFTADDVVHTGHSIECRINAENPATGFSPSPGTIAHLRLPAGPGVRWDGGYAQGDTVSQYYDNLIGKLVVWAPDRETARKRMLRALGEFEISGLHTTIPAHVALLSTDDFANVNHSTKWVEDEVDAASFSEAAAPEASAADDADEAEPLLERTIPVEVDGKRYSVKLWLPEAAAGTATPKKRSARPRPGAGGVGRRGRQRHDLGADAGHHRQGARRRGRRGRSRPVGARARSHEDGEPHQRREGGHVKEVRVAAGDTVGTGDVLVVIE